MAATKEEILEAIASMTVLEVSELVKAMEEKFGVSAAAPVAVAVAGAGAAPAAAAVEEKTMSRTPFRTMAERSTSAPWRLLL